MGIVLGMALQAERWQIRYLVSEGRAGGGGENVLTVRTDHLYPALSIELVGVADKWE